MVGGRRAGRPTAARKRSQRADVGAPSQRDMLDVLNGVTKSHGQLSWLIEYSREYPEFRYSCDLLITFEGKFGGIGPAACSGY